ncbi:hypothetical protein LPB72_08915 [Hydrogenophaga crassostreae]|uniref:Uncharacterized protein n=1 Tax=Hydrogenophaga crassostreae TaxID=1763535 RepID=A0A162T176_9BURK|nr:hypothetical protein [Hydrogenophaga crassostreae]AOW11824.1 hypothetical protein LPB072_02035 [Hydrogenophaga crassostreae]OAD42328.1 hypothetical protein LPB72_08915 [Hydrogenophaga crassostreae]
MQLNYLIFDASDDGEGTGTWEAMASVRDADWPDAKAEAQAVLSAAMSNEPGPRGPLDEGGAWDADEQTSRDGEWTTVTLTLTGPWEWGEALMREFEVDG